jgi:hypothetical protein
MVKGFFTPCPADKEKILTLYWEEKCYTLLVFAFNDELMIRYTVFFFRILFVEGYRSTKNRSQCPTCCWTKLLEHNELGIFR